MAEDVVVRAEKAVIVERMAVKGVNKPAWTRKEWRCPVDRNNKAREEKGRYTTSKIDDDKVEAVWV